MRPPRGTVLLVALLLIGCAVLSGREAFREKSFPAVSIEKTNKINVLLATGFPGQGIYQFSDGIDLVSAIKLTIPCEPNPKLLRKLRNIPLLDGECLSIVVKDNEIIDINLTWMAASQRMACGIALHPDRMSSTDWQALPGIGPRLADKIEKDRQKNGGFGSLGGLKRVQGIGNKTIDNLKGFF